MTPNDAGTPPPPTEDYVNEAPANSVVFQGHMKPEFDTQVSALSDRETPSAPTTPAHPPVKTLQLPDTDMPSKPAPGILRDTSSGAASTAALSVKTSVTFGGQPELKPLPIPSLEETLQKFLQSIEALQADDEPAARTESKRVVMDFLNTEGPILQKLLLEYDRVGRETGEIGSYVEEFWNDSYLAPDSSVVLNLNPFFVLEDSPDPKIAKHGVKRAASLCFASVKLASQLRFETLKPDTFKGKPLCMDQFKALFSTARVPMLHAKDSIHVFDKSNHLAVLCQGKVYYFQALWPDGHVAVDEGDLVDILTAIQSHAHEEGDDDLTRSQQSIGVLTSLPRKEWAMAREELIRHSPKNEESLKIIDSALFVLVLDDYIPQNKHDAAANMLHGSYLLKQYSLEGSDSSSENNGGTSSSPSHNHVPSSSATHSSSMNDWLVFSDYQAGSCCNRWYDKMQIIVCGDGTAGINFEHSAIDGHTALRFVSDVYAETVISFAQSITKLVAAHDMIPNVINAKVRRAATALDAQGRATLDVFPKKLHFEIPETVQRKIYYAETALGDEIVASETYVLEFKDYGKNFITSQKLSPDSYVQMSMMLAYYKLYGRIVCAYEPVLTKNFYHGRTEAMRPATMEARRLCQVFVDPKASVADKVAALRNATKVHSQLVQECAQGKGVDRHLFALKCIAEKNGLPIPAFFHSKPWKLLNHTVLSTSNCGNPALAGFGFGPVVPDGLGIGYLIKDYQLHYSISSKHRQTRRYAYTLEATLREMASLFASAQETGAGAALRADAAAHRQQLKNIPLDMISYDSYGDIWGESSSPAVPTKATTTTTTTAAPTTVSPQVQPKQRWSADTALISNTSQDDLVREDEGATDEDDDGIVVLALRDATAEPSSSVGGGSEGGSMGGRAKRRGSKDSIPVQPGRHGSTTAFDLTCDRSFRKPGTDRSQPYLQQLEEEDPPHHLHKARHSSSSNNNHRMVGPFQRQSSFEYAELSQKGLKIEMDSSNRSASASRRSVPQRNLSVSENSFGIHDLHEQEESHDD